MILPLHHPLRRRVRVVRRAPPQRRDLMLDVPRLTVDGRTITTTTISELINFVIIASSRGGVVIAVAAVVVIVRRRRRPPAIATASAAFLQVALRCDGSHNGVSGIVGKTPRRGRPSDGFVAVDYVLHHRGSRAASSVYLGTSVVVVVDAVPPPLGSGATGAVTIVVLHRSAPATSSSAFGSPGLLPLLLLAVGEAPGPEAVRHVRRGCDRAQKHQRGLERTLATFFDFVLDFALGCGAAVLVLAHLLLDLVFEEGNRRPPPPFRGSVFLLLLLLLLLETR
ncbi:hypothetical protein PG984_014597 [Apiospora sp. TS-2023a]